MSQAAQYAASIFGQAQGYASSAYSATTSIISGLGGMPDISIGTSSVSITVQSPPTIAVPPLPVEPDVSAVIPTDVPQPPDLTPQQYYSDFLDAIRKWMTARIETGGTGLLRQAEIYSFEDARNTQTLADAEARLMVNPSPWAYPAGCLSMALSRFQDDYANETLDVARERRINEEKYALEQLKFAVAAGVELEKALMLYWPKIAQALAYIFDAEVSAYDAEVTAVIAAIDVAVKKYTALISAYETSADIQQVTAGNYNKLMDAEARAARQQADIIITEIEAKVRAAIRLGQEQAEVILDVAKSGAQMCAGAMAAAHAQANIGSTESFQSESSLTYRDDYDSFLRVQVDY